MKLKSVLLAFVFSGIYHFCKNASLLNTVELFILAVGLSMDGFAISIANGILMPRLKFQKALTIAFMMGLFHFIMPVLGYYFASAFEEKFEKIDHWIAFVLLAYIGGKMMYESFRNNNSRSQESLDISFSQLMLQSLATSIDALVVGISLGLLDIHIFKASFFIGSVTFFMIMFGLKAGTIIGSGFGKRMEFLGGLILVLIGTKILSEHLFYL